MSDVLEKGTSLFFKFQKAISTKGRVLLANSIPGRYTVLVPFTNSIGISKKIDTPEERERLLQVLQK